MAHTATALPPTIRVLLLESLAPQSIEIRTDGQLHLLADGRSLATIPSGQRVTITASGNQLHVAWPGGRHQARALALDGADLLHLRVVQGRERVTRAYRGSIACSSARGRLHLINHVAMDDYVSSVVASEYPFTEPEGVKAQAVAARTYVMYQMAESAARAYDVKDNASSQIYKGAGLETDVTRVAARETTGEILTYGGQPILAAFYSSSGGHTASNETIWNGAPVAYLRARPDPYDTASPHHRWTYRVPRARLLSVLSKAYGFSVTGISVGEQSREGRVVTMQVHGRNTRSVRGNDFRMKVTQALGITSLRSTLFDLRVAGNDYVFEGRGFGHGIGMSQYGARAMAQQGHSYREILAFYYAGARLESSGPRTRPPVTEATYSDRRISTAPAYVQTTTPVNRRGW